MASTRSVAIFARRVSAGATSGLDGPGTEADRRGVGWAKTVVALSDNGHGIPAMLGRHFTGITISRVADFYHSAERLADVAGVAAGPTAQRRKQRLFQSLRDDLWH